MTTLPHTKNYSTANSIAFKPAESGWGGGSKYGNNYDAIFGGSKSKKRDDDNGRRSIDAEQQASS